MTKADASNAIAVAPPSMLRGKTIEEIVNRWSSELETHVKEFNKFAGEVAVWDRALIENSKNVRTPASTYLSLMLSSLRSRLFTAMCLQRKGSKTISTSRLTTLNNSRKIFPTRLTLTKRLLKRSWEVRVLASGRSILGLPTRNVIKSALCMTQIGLVVFNLRLL